MDFVGTTTAKEGISGNASPLTYPEQVFPRDFLPQFDSSELEAIPTLPTHAMGYQYAQPGVSHASEQTTKTVNAGGFRGFAGLGTSQSIGVYRTLTDAPVPDWPHLGPTTAWMAVDGLQSPTLSQLPGIEAFRIPESAINMSNNVPSEDIAGVVASALSAETSSDDPFSRPPPPQTQFRHVLPSPIKPKASLGSHSPEVWQSHKGTIKKLYLDEGRPLKDVMRIMQERHNFKASTKMYKVRLCQWGFEKNITEKEMSRMLLVKFQRDISGKPSQFFRHSRKVNFQNYLRRKGVTEYDLVDFETTAELPMGVRCVTPPLTQSPGPEYLKSPEVIRYQELLLQHVRNVLHWRQKQRTPPNSGLGPHVSHIEYYIPDSGPTHLLDEIAKYYKPGGLFNTAILLRKLVFRRLQETVREQSTLDTIRMLLNLCEISDPEIILTFWKMQVEDVSSISFDSTNAVQ